MQSFAVAGLAMGAAAILGAGIYWSRLQVGAWRSERKMVILD